DAPEVAVDSLEPNDLLDAIDGGHVAVDDEPSVGFAVDRLEVVDAVVHRPGEVGGGAPGLAAADRSVVDDDDLLARLGEVVGGGEPRDAGADDADVSGQVAGEGSEVWDFEGAHPYRSGVAGWVG